MPFAAIWMELEIVILKEESHTEKEKFHEIPYMWNLKRNDTDHQPRLDAWDKCSGLVHWEDPEGSGGEGGGRRDRDGEYM